MIRKSLLCASAAMTLALSAAPLASAMAASEKTPASADTYQLMNLFGDVFERVRNEYVEPVKDDDLIEAALNGMLTSLDPHSSYLNPKNFKDMQVQTKGEFGGLGIEVTQDNGLVKVVSPIDETPAFRAGLQPNDLITHLDGEPVMGLTLNEAVDRMRGPVNTSIRLTVRRNGMAPFDVSLTRAIIKIQSVRPKTFENVGYVRITQFAETTDGALRKAVADIRKNQNNLVGFIIDLRNNPGGLLDQAVAVSDDFLDRGEIVSTRSRRPEETQRWNSKAGDITDGLPLVVLINEGSASASEIVAGALQDHRRALILGTKSFGKGSVQTIIPLPPNHGAMRLTTARYYTPSGRSIQAVGIEPDIKVQPARIETLAANETGPHGEAALRGALRNDTVQQPATPAPATPAAPGAAPTAPNTAPAAPGQPGAATTPAQPQPPITLGEPATDYQLARAIDLLRGLSLYKGAGK